MYLISDHLEKAWRWQWLLKEESALDLELPVFVVGVKLGLFDWIPVIGGECTLRTPHQVQRRFVTHLHDSRVMAKCVVLTCMRCLETRVSECWPAFVVFVGNS